MIEQMKSMKKTLMNCVQSQLGDLSSVNAEELGEVVDMIKDFSEAIYYCTITESMEGKEQYGNAMYNSMPANRQHYGGYRDMDKPYGRMYYEERYNSTHTEPRTDVGGHGEPGKNYPIEIRDYREGRSPIMRKTYMERKMHGGAKEVQMHELEKYLHELSNDITEMIEGASAEEKQMLKTKITALATKIV